MEKPMNVDPVEEALKKISALRQRAQEIREEEGNLPTHLDAPTSLTEFRITPQMRAEAKARDRRTPPNSR
jgi:hypothetical protein